MLTKKQKKLPLALQKAILKKQKKTKKKLCSKFASYNGSSNIKLLYIILQEIQTKNILYSLYCRKQTWLYRPNREQNLGEQAGSQ